MQTLNSSAQGAAGKGAALPWTTQAHDIKNITSSLSIIADELTQRDQDRIKMLGSRLEKCCDRIMSICAPPRKAQHSGAHPEALSVLVSDAMELAQFMGEGGVTLSSRMPDIRLDPLRAASVYRILLNLMLNAVMAHTGEGGSVCLVGRQRGARVEIDVIDNGPGLTPCEMPMPKRRNLPRGSGAGIAICDLLAEDIGGEITMVRSTAQGTHFTLCFPIEAPKAKPNAADAVKGR